MPSSTSSLLYVFPIVNTFSYEDQDLANITQAALSLIWSFSEIICIAVRGGHRGIHPGACVGLDLIIWLVFLVMVIIYALVGVLFRPYGSSYDYYGYNYGDTSNVEASMSMYRTIFSFAIILL